MTLLEQIKERIEKLRDKTILGGILGPQDFQRGYSLGHRKGRESALSDVKELLPSIIQEVEEATKRAVREDLMEHFGEVYNCPCGNEVSYFWGNLPSLKEESK